MDSDDESEGEEEVLETWRVTDSGKIMVVPKSGEPQMPQTVIRSSSNQESQSSFAGVSSPLVVANSQPRATQQQQPYQNKALTAAPIAPRPSTAEPVESTPLKAIWYLGGNHIIKLLTSVDGDFDHQVLSMLASVPAVVGELALSVEALVSDDFTVGGFEDDLLAKIASNTLAAKRASMPLPVPEPVAQVEPPPQPIEAPMPECSQPSSVPNPLASYKPVPNPLARITPPGSPVAITAFLSEKRKELPTSLALPAAKRARIELPVPGIQAR
jgi:hypothetical protein